MKSCLQFVIFGPGKMEKSPGKVQDFLWADGVQILGWIIWLSQLFQAYK